MEWRENVSLRFGFTSHYPTLIRFIINFPKSSLFCAESLTVIGE